MASHGNIAAAVNVAAAMEALAAGLDVLDEIEDGDTSPFVSSVGLPLALNTSTALIFLSQRLISESSETCIDPQTVLDMQITIARLGLRATSGQHDDLSSTSHSDLSLSEALQISIDKSGSLAALACRLGARIGTADSETLHLYERLGQNYGTMVQLSNDLHDAQNDHQKTDLANSKPTLPLLYYSRQTDDSATDKISSHGVIQSGAIHFTWTIFELQRQRCLSILDELDTRDQATSHLRSIVGESGHQELAADG